MKKNFLFKGVAMLGTISLLANVVLPGLQVYADNEVNLNMNVTADVIPAGNITDNEDAAFNQGLAAVEYNEETSTYVIKANLAKLHAYASATPAQGTHKWIAIDVNTNMDSITNVTWNGGALVEGDVTEANHVGLSAGHIVFWAKADELTTTRTITLGSAGYNDFALKISFEESYDVTFINSDGTTISTKKYAKDTSSSDIELPTKGEDSTCNTYSLSLTPALTNVTDDVIYKATFTCTSKKSSGGSSSGGGGGSTKKSTTETKATTGDNAKVDTTKNDNTNDEGDNVNEGNNQNVNTNNYPIITQEDIEKYGQEQLLAYKWAYENGITTMNNVKDARLDQPLTRAELAKMMVVYVAKILEKQPVLTGDVNYQDVKTEELGDLAGYIKLAYQYQIMGINADGTPIDFFNPNGIVSRGEYATVFSRVLFGSLFNKEGEDFYTNHLKALEAAGILSNTEPTIQEMRGWVMLMMYRSSKNTDKIAEVISTLGASEEEAADAQAKAEEEKVVEAPEAETTTGDVAEAPEAEASTGAVAE